MRFTHNTRVREQERLTVPLTPTELRAAQNYPVKRAQVESFGEEIECLKRGQEIHKQSGIKSLDPRMEDGFLVIGGRLGKAQSLPYKMWHLKITDSHHEFAQLVTEEMHRTYHHPPTEHLLNLVRQEYWIVNGHQAVQNMKFKCSYCHRQTVKPQEQHMGNLPECRLEPGIVFRNTGVDFSDLYSLKKDTAKVKCMVVCLFA